MDRPAGQRTLTNLLLAIGALALGLLAQHYFAPFGGMASLSSPVDGLLVYAVVVALFIAAVLRTPFPPGLPVRPPPTNPKLDARRGARSTVLWLLSGLALTVSLGLFRESVGSSLSWYLYLAAMSTFMAGAYALSPPAPAPLQREPVQGGLARALRSEGMLLLLILLLGAFLRLHRFTELPYGLWYDEADNGLSARRILADPGYRPVYVPSTNLPAHFLYLIALSFKLLGDSMYAIRAVAVVFGLSTIVVAYRAGRELFGTSGPHFGLIMAFLLAVSRWDINWSRIGMHGVTLPFFELWVIAALLRGLRTGRLTSFAWAGIATGLGLCFYSPFRLFPAALALFALAWFWKWLRQASRDPRPPISSLLRRTILQWGMPALLIVSGTLIAVSPVAQFATHYRDLFWDRAKRVLVFKDPDVQARPATALLESTSKHLLMFNYRGDSNGRHNLPGAPMLDRLSAILLVLGSVICCVRWRDPRSVLLICWMMVSLAAGIFSTWFEAPQSLRSIGALPAAYAIACLPMAWFAAEWRHVFQPRRSSLSSRWAVKSPLGILVVLILLAIGLENAVTYFVYWARDFASWAAFNPAETRMAQDIRLYQETYELRFDPLLTAHLATRYLNPDYEAYHHFDPATVLPIRSTDKQGVLLFLSPDTRSVREQAVALYPEARVENFAHPESGNVVMYRLFFPLNSIRARHGLDAGCLSLQPGSPQLVRRTDERLDFSWGQDPPCAYPFQVTWTGGLLAPEYGTYALQAQTSAECTLELDGGVVFQGTGPQDRQIAMAQGVHNLQVDCLVVEPGDLRLMWRTPGDPAPQPVPGDALYRSSWPVRGLLGRLYPTDDWSGEPALERIDRQVAYYFHFLPLPRPYTVEWLGRLVAPVSGTYRLGVRAISSADLHIDEQPVIEDAAPGQYTDAEIDLAAGTHEIRLRYLDNQSHSQVYLYWQVPDGPPELIPPEALFLPAEGAWRPVP